MKKNIANSLAMACVIAFCSMSCSDQDETVGRNFINNTTKAFFIDTLTVKTSTFQFDSIGVNNTKRLLIGAYTDPVFGVTKSKVYTRFANSYYNIDETAVYDSIELILKYDGYYYNDTIPFQEFNIYRVTENIKPRSDLNYYNTMAFEIESNPIATSVFQPKINKVDSLRIRINDDFGNLLFNEIQGNDFNDYVEFINRYKGFLIEPSESNTTVLGFSNTSYFRVYYTVPDGDDDTDVTLDLAFDTTNSFHNISSNQQNTYFSSLESQETYINSTETDNNSFIQSGTAIATKINLPFLESIREIQGTGTVLSASLTVSLKRNSSTNNLRTRDSLALSIINQRSEVVSELLQYDTSSALGLIDDVTEPEFNITRYKIPLKLFVDLKLTDPNRANYYLALYSQDFNASVDRYILNGEEADNDLKIKLELTYAVYDE